MENAVQNATDSAAVDPSTEAAIEVPTNATDYATWRQKGTLPSKESKQPPKTEDSAASTTADEKTVESAPASEADKAVTTHKKLTAKERSAQLDAEIAELNEKLAKRAELRKQVAQPDDKKTAAPSTAEAKDGKAPVKPKQEDFKTWDEYEEARDKYFEDLADHKAAKAIADDRAARQQEAAQKALQEKVDEGKQRYPDFEKVVAPAAKALMSDPEIPDLVKLMINDSPVFTDLLYVMGSDPAELSDFLTLAKVKPLDALRKIAVSEELIRQELAGKSEKRRDADGKFKSDVVAEKKSTEAPPPPKEVGGRGAAAGDEVDQAFKNGDVRAFRAAQNRRDLERRKGI